MKAPDLLRTKGIPSIRGLGASREKVRKESTVLLLIHFRSTLLVFIEFFVAVLI